MSNNDASIHPSVRGWTAVVATLGTVICSDWIYLAAAWLVVMLPMQVASGIAKTHLRFLFILVLPIAVALVLVWGWLVGAPPDGPLKSDPEGGVRFALAIALRLLVIGGIWQLCFLTLSPSALVATLRAWGLKHDLILATISTLNVLPEMRRRSEQVLTARTARGLTSTGPWGRLRSLPTILVPLIAWALRSAIERGKVIHQRGLLERHADPRVTGSVGPRGRRTAASIAVASLGVSWLLINLGLSLW